MATDNVIDRLQDLLAAARAERDETEAGRTLTEPVLTALVEHGLFRLGARSLGGSTAEPFEILAVLERANRDALVMMQHVTFDPQWTEQAGRVRLGLQPTHPLFTR